MNLRNAGVESSQIEELSRHKTIVELLLAGSTIDDSALPSIAKFKNLQRLELSYTPVTGEGVALLNGLSSLIELDLSHTGVKDKDFACVKRLPALKVLVIDRWQATEAVLHELESHERLESIVEGDERRPVWSRGPGKQGSEWFWNEPKPVAFQDRQRMLEVAVERLGGQLLLDEVDEKKVEGTYFVKLTGAAFEPGQLKLLLPFRSIVTLSLSHTRANDESMAYVAQVKSLQSLYLSKSEVTGKGVALLEELPSLTQLFLEETKIHGNEFKCVLKLKKLKELWLDDSQTTLSVLPYLEQHPSLQEVNRVDENEKSMVFEAWLRGRGIRRFEKFWKSD